MASTRDQWIDTLRYSMKAVATTFAAGLLIGGAACDSATPVAAPPPPATAPARAEEAPASRRPTTQALVDGAWKTVPLSVLPMTVRVPASWQPSPVGEGGLLALEGWSPSGAVLLQASVRVPLSEDRIEGFIEAARRESERRGPRGLRFEVRRTPEMIVIERQFVEDPRPMLYTEDDGTLNERVATPLRWSQLVFLRQPDGRFNSYELSFTDLSKEHYDRDAEFLQKVLSSLAYDPSRRD